MEDLAKWDDKQKEAINTIQRHKPQDQHKDNKQTQLTVFYSNKIDTSLL